MTPLVASTLQNRTVTTTDFVGQKQYPSVPDRTSNINSQIDPGTEPKSVPVQYMDSEDDAHLQTLCRMSDGDAEQVTPVSLSCSGQGRQVIEYYGELNSLTVLGEILGQSQRRLIRIDLPGVPAVGAKQRELSRLEPADISYLTAKRVHDLPSRETWYVLLR